MNRLPILHTRFYKPEVRDDYVIREQIIQTLQKNRHKPLALVVAATGYGKSVTISEWLDVTKTRHCWISVDVELNDLRLFLAHIVFGLRNVFPASFPELSNILEAPELPSESTLSSYLINELDEIGEECILVLDDYHFITNQTIHSILDELLKYIPRGLHLVIIARRDPPLRISTLKSYGGVNDVRMSDLGFTSNETVSLAKRLTHLALSEKFVELLLKRTEGWIVGLRLALLTMADEKDLEKAFEDMEGDRHFFTQYLLDEVFLRQDKEVRDILLIASIFDRFNKELLAVLMKDHPSISKKTNYSVFDNLFERSNTTSLFIIPLDSNGKWFRYHHFFKDFLMRRLESEYSANNIHNLHKRASEYFDGNELFDEALKHALLSGDVNLAVEVIDKNKYRFIDTDQFGRLQNWLNLLPGGTIEKHLSLLLARAFLYDTVKDYASMRNDLFLADKLLPNSGDDVISHKQLQGEFHTVYSNLTFNEGRFQDALQHSRKALDLLTDSSAYLREYALAHQAFSLNALGKFSDAIAIFGDLTRTMSPSESIGRLRQSIVQSMLYAFQGNLPEIMKLALAYHSISVEKELWVSLAYSTYYLSEISYQWNNLDEAVDYAATLGDHYYSGRPPWVLQTLYTKAFAFQALRKGEELRHTIIEIKEVTDNINNEVFRNCTRAFEVELAIRQNDIAKGLEIANKTNFESFLPIFQFYFPQLTYVKLLMSSDGPEKIAEAEKRAEALIEQGRSTFKYNILVQALLLQSLLFKKKENFKSAVKTMREAIRLAEPGGFIRIFVDLGEPMRELLSDVSRSEPDSSYISTLLQAFEREKARTEKSQNVQQELRPALLLNGLEKLSGREINLLKLIAEGKRNQEIAEQLHLSVDSIKKYLYYIYQKLDVRNRVAAIKRASELGLIARSNQAHYTL